MSTKVFLSFSLTHFFSFPSIDFSPCFIALTFHVSPALVIRFFYCIPSPQSRNCSFGRERCTELSQTVVFFPWNFGLNRSWLQFLNRQNFFTISGDEERRIIPLCAHPRLTVTPTVCWWPSAVCRDGNVQCRHWMRCTVQRWTHKPLRAIGSRSGVLVI